MIAATLAHIDATHATADVRPMLVEVSGRDRPGITTGVLAILHRGAATVEDIEQVVIRGRLTLGFLVGVPPGANLLSDLLVFGWEHDLNIEFEPAPSLPSPHRDAQVVTVLGPELSPGQLERITGAIADAGGNIQRIERLSRYPVWSYEFRVTGVDGPELRKYLVSSASDVDVAVQAEGLYRRVNRLIVFDVDSTLIRNEVIDLLAAEAGTLEEVSAITDDAMAGRIDFEKSLRARVALLEGLDEAAIERAWQNVELTPGARTVIRTLRRLGMTIVLVSGGFTAFTDRLVEELGVDAAHANKLEVRDGKLTGALTGRIIDRAAKAQLLREIAEHREVPLDQTIAVGDGANDLDMLDAAGLGVAFCARPLVADVADTTLSLPYLDALLFLLGIRREHIEEADELDPSFES